jgi:serine protease AprX
VASFGRRLRSRRLLVFWIALWVLVSAPTAPAQQIDKLDPLLRVIVTQPVGRSFVLVQGSLGLLLDQLILALGGKLGVELPLIGARAADVPNTSILTLANSLLVQRIALDRPMGGSLERTSAAIGASSVRQEAGLDGRGVGVAFIDSGVTSWHDDLTPVGSATTQRIARFVDFVNNRASPYDDFGHGTHVTGIVGGNGYDSNGARSGIAPGATLSVLKVLNASGEGRISHVIAALGFVMDNQRALNIRIVNVSVGAAVSESYTTDMLARATRRVVERGIVVVAAAGNLGRDSAGHTQYGGITAPGNAPWVLTVGASTTNSTTNRGDDAMASFC